MKYGYAFNLIKTDWLKINIYTYFIANFAYFVWNFMSQYNAFDFVLEILK